ncbi:MAG: hypothetical protein ACRDK3_09760 [Actinomycetota bacterium]
MRQPSGSVPPPPPPPPPEPRRHLGSRGVKFAVALLAVALVAVSALAFVGLQRTGDLQDRLDEQERAQEEPENPLDDLLDDLGVGGEPDDLLDDFGGGGDLLGGSNADLLECLGSGSGGGLGDLFGEGSGSQDEGPRKLVTTISKQVEKVRELRFEKPVDAEFLRKPQLEKRVGELFLQGYSRRDAALEARVLAALGAIPRDTDLFETRKSALEGQVSGFYVPSTEELVVLSGDEIGPLEKVTLAHELEHALADQRLGLPLSERSDPETADADLATLAVVEGDATLTMQRWSLAHLSLSDQLAMLSGSPGLQRSQAELEAMPHFIQQQLTFPYLDGLGFVCAIQSNGGWAAVDRAYDRPPPSTDQVLFPERYDSKAKPVPTKPIGEPGGGWSNPLSGSFGAAELKWLFGAPGGDVTKALPDPLERAGAWGGGEFELWTDGGRSAVGVGLAQRRSSDGLCESVTRWYAASFDDDRESVAGGAALVAEGGAQDAVITCSGDDVKIGIGPSLAVARSLTE